MKTSKQIGIGIVLWALIALTASIFMPIKSNRTTSLMNLLPEEPTPPAPAPFALTSTAHAQSSSISGLANISTLQSNYLFVIAIPGVANRNIAYGQLTNLIAAMLPTNIGGVTYITVLNTTTNYATYSYLTNVDVFNTFNVSGKATMNIVTMLSATATNGFFVNTNFFNGPTNPVDLSIEDQGYQTFTPFSITGVFNKSNNVVETVIMTFTNGASTNVLGTLAAGIVIPQRTNQVALSNNSMATLTLRYHGKFGTNGIWVQF
jgi:hypothetical protein